MNEKIVATSVFIKGTTAGNHVFIQEFPFPATLIGVKACSSNDSDATLAVSGGSTVTAAVIGDTADPAYLEPTAATANIAAAADTAFTFTLNYDGASGTAADDVSIVAFYLLGEG